jgi:PAS domain-containing protein
LRQRSNPREPSPLGAELIVANAPDPVFVCDLNGKIVVANDTVS